MTAPTFTGTHDGVAYSCRPARYSKGKAILQINDTAAGGFKARAHWLAEALGGRWARGHEQGYRIAPTRAEQWQTLFLAGFSATPRYFHDSPAATFSRGSGPQLSLADALREIGSRGGN